MVAALLFSGCQTIEIKNSTWCLSFGRGQGGVCEDTLTSKQVMVSDADYLAWLYGEPNPIESGMPADQLKPKAATSTQTLADWKSDLEKLCSDSNECFYRTQPVVTTFGHLLDFSRRAR